MSEPSNPVIDERIRTGRKLAVQCIAKGQIEESKKHICPDDFKFRWDACFALIETGHIEAGISYLTIEEVIIYKDKLREKIIARLLKYG